jgi:thiamine-monophosphate kinase
LSVSDVGEFGLITRVAARLAPPPPPAGPGDDAAVVPVRSGAVVASTDLLVEGRHFRLDWSTPYDVGRKAAAQSLADIVAMGGVPTALLIGLACPPDTPLAVTDGIAEGLRDECRPTGARVVGGDVVSAGNILLAVTALGDLDGLGPVTRAGARPGDTVVLAGTVGRSAAGLELLLAGVSTGPLVAAHRNPAPPYRAGPALARAGATSMIDVSDGLLADLGHVAEASGVVIEVDVDLLVALQPDVAPVHLLTGGEDHGLVATLPPGVTPPAGAHAIGTVIAAAAADRPAEARAVGRHVPAGLAAGRRGWDHFAGPGDPRGPGDQAGREGPGESGD